MKPSELKSFIKEAVREAIQEELKDILLEAVRAPKLPIQETYQVQQELKINARLIHPQRLPMANKRPI